jgi:hypothetical protein
MRENEDTRLFAQYQAGQRRRSCAARRLGVLALRKFLSWSLRGKANMPYRRALALCGTIFTLVSGPSIGQDRDPNAVTEAELQELFDQGVAATHWVPSPSSIAMRMLETYELVATGEFLDFPAEMADDPAVLAPRYVIVEFTPIAVYKGDAAPGFPIAVRLNSDMLSFPGEPGISRYAKRQQVRQEQIQQGEELNRELALLAEDLQNERITAQEFRAEEARLLSRREELIAESLATRTRIVAVSHSTTFYDLGGVISPRVHYLVGLNRTLENVHVYLLEEIPQSGPNIIWGEMFDEITGVLDSQSR